MVKKGFLFILLMAAWAFAALDFGGSWPPGHGFFKPAPGPAGAVAGDAGIDPAAPRPARQIWVGDPNYAPTIQGCLAVIGNTPATLHLPAGTYNITADLTIPAHINLKPERGALLAVAGGVTLTIKGGLETGLYQIFACRGSGKVVGNRAIPHAYAEWFGAKGDGIGDDTAALQAAYDFARGNSEVRLATADYLISNTVYLTTSTIGQGSSKSIFVLKDVDWDKPALVITGIGYAFPPAKVSLHQAFSAKFAFIAGIIEDMRAINRSSAWGDRFQGWGIRPAAGWYHRSTRKQHGLLVQQTALINVEDIRIGGLNGLGLMEDGVQDCTFRNIHVDHCGRDAGPGDQYAARIIDSVTDGGFNSASRVHHYYEQVESSSYAGFYTGEVGSRGPGLGGSSLNTFWGVHSEKNPRQILCGFMDVHEACSYYGAAVRLAGSQTFAKCEFGGSAVILDAPLENAGNELLNCRGLGSMQLVSGYWKLHSTDGDITINVTSGNPGLWIYNSDITLASTAGYPQYLYCYNSELGLKTFAGFMAMKECLISGCRVTDYHDQIARIYGQFRDCPSITSVSARVAFGFHGQSRATNCTFAKTVKCAGGASFQPAFYYCNLEGGIDDGAGGNAPIAAKVSHCLAGGSILMDPDLANEVTHCEVRVGNVATNKAFHNIIAGTLTAPTKAGNYKLSDGSPYEERARPATGPQTPPPDSLRPRTF